MSHKNLDSVKYWIIIHYNFCIAGNAIQNGHDNKAIQDPLSISVNTTAMRKNRGLI